MLPPPNLLFSYSFINKHIINILKQRFALRWSRCRYGFSPDRGTATPNSSKISAVVSTSFAPSRSKACGLLERGEKIDPGTAKTAVVPLNFRICAWPCAGLPARPPQTPGIRYNNAGISYIGIGSILEPDWAGLHASHATKPFTETRI